MVVSGPILMRIHAVSLCPMSEAQKGRLSVLGDLHYWDAKVGDPRIGELVSGAEILITTPRLSIDITPFLDGCKMISVQAAGMDAFNLEACRARGIRVANVPEFCTDAVAEHAFALLLAVAKRLEAGRPLLRTGGWTDALAYPTLGLRGRTLGLFGCGRIGSRIAELGRAFGMDVIATVRNASRRRPGVEPVDFRRLLADSDFLVLAAPATPDTTGVLNRRAFEQMKPSAVLVNVSRGALVVDEDLLEALDRGLLAGAATDVYRQEPPSPNDPLLAHPRLVVSPHVAWGTGEAVERLLDISIDNVEAFLRGEARNVVVWGKTAV